MKNELPVIPRKHVNKKWILFYPSTATTMNDFLMIRPYLSAIIKEIRHRLSRQQKRQVRERDARTCQFCGAPGRQVDHVEELWIFAIETIVQQQPHDEDDLRQIVKDVRTGIINVVEPNALDNLRVLCKTCNGARNDYLRIRQMLESKYPVVFKGAEEDQFKIAFDRR